VGLAPELAPEIERERALVVASSRLRSPGPSRLGSEGWQVCGRPDVVAAGDNVVVGVAIDDESLRRVRVELHGQRAVSRTMSGSEA
jgi:hypothetical protein